jgi:hypothetical protein
MKNQHFGENRDLLKFDLVSQVLASGLVEQLVYVPMLTPDDPALEAEHICRHESTGGGGNTELINFLDFCVVNEKRQVNQLEDYFKTAGRRAKVYAPDQIMTRENRRAYFQGLSKELSAKSLILLDPDSGLEDDDNDPAHLMYSEIRDIYNVIDTDSILMFTQRFPYDMYKEYLAMRTTEIKNQIPFSQPVSLDDLDTIIFFLPRTSQTLYRLVQVLKDYTQKYAQQAKSE